jgi:hypothetical protein
MTRKAFSSWLSLLLVLPVRLAAAETVFSGPQPGEKVTPFKVLEVTGDGAGKERDPIAEGAGKPIALVFLHGVERSLVPLLRVVDQYGADRQDRIRTEVIFLSGDRLSGEERLKAVAGSLKLSARVGLSLDGAEGPGNYGLNKECLMTIVAAKEDKVTANFALVQPGIADAPKVIAALAKTCGDESPPSIEELSQRQAARGGGREGRAMRREGARGEASPERQAVDLSRFDLNSEAGLRDAVRALIEEVRSLRAEVAALKGGAPPPARGEAKAERPLEEFPGAVPTDDKLQGLLRRFIQPSNDDATVDRLRGEVEAYVKDDAGLRKQAIDGWTRILHFGDRYGTAYARKVGQDLLAKLKAEAK